MLGMYIHIPFCKKICSYCDFCKILYQEKYIDEYLDALEKEINDRYKGEKVGSIYIGGGTPSSLKGNDLERLLKMLSKVKRDNNFEYTIECNVNDINMDFINTIKKYGINRVSVGVESFRESILKILGRVVDLDTIFNNIRLLKQYFKNISIDLIYGVNDNKEVIESDIAKFLELDIPHVSCYSLIIEEHTKLFIDKHKYISEDDEYLMYKYIKDTLNKHGYKHYEVSNYAKDGYESKHNKIYWHNLSYYGFGLGAVSYIDNFRISNTKNLSKYLCGEYIQDKLYEDIQMRKENTIILGLRLIDGIDIDEYNKRYNSDILNKSIIKKYIDLGYLEVVNNHLRCKDEYLYIENKILEDIIGEEL